MWMHTTHFPSAKNIALRWEWLEGQQMLHSKCYIPKGSKDETNQNPILAQLQNEVFKKCGLVLSYLCFYHNISNENGKSIALW